LEAPCYEISRIGIAKFSKNGEIYRYFPKGAAPTAALNMQVEDALTLFGINEEKWACRGLVMLGATA